MRVSRFPEGAVFPTAFLSVFLAEEAGEFGAHEFHGLVGLVEGRSHGVLGALDDGVHVVANRAQSGGDLLPQRAA